MNRRAALRMTFVFAAAFTASAAAPLATAGAQVEEHLAPSVVAGLAKSIADAPVPVGYVNRPDLSPWLAEMGRRISHKVADERERRELLATIHYEATRSGLDPQLVLAVAYHESGLKKYAISIAGARGYMQVMPFWTQLINSGGDHNLFNLRTNLRYGTVILRHYLNIESGDVYRALGRYNGSLGRAEYPTAVMAAQQRHFAWTPVGATAANAVGTAAPR